MTFPLGSLPLLNPLAALGGLPVQPPPWQLLAQLQAAQPLAGRSVAVPAVPATPVWVKAPPPQPRQPGGAADGSDELADALRKQFMDNPDLMEVLNKAGSGQGGSEGTNLDVAAALREHLQGTGEEKGSTAKKEGEAAEGEAAGQGSKAQQEDEEEEHVKTPAGESESEEDTAVPATAAGSTAPAAAVSKASAETSAPPQTAEAAAAAAPVPSGEDLLQQQKGVTTRAEPEQRPPAEAQPPPLAMPAVLLRRQEPPLQRSQEVAPEAAAAPRQPLLGSSATSAPLAEQSRGTLLPSKCRYEVAPDEDCDGCLANLRRRIEVELSSGCVVQMTMQVRRPQGKAS
mmetsp:Transcript_9880/g.22102  ORF Transcript_9880/g.22102 Transcript_9880/m.22102 type:complete len:343 (-) Transcript_9880:68-1096(-)